MKDPKYKFGDKVFVIKSGHIYTGTITGISIYEGEVFRYSFGSGYYWEHEITDNKEEAAEILMQQGDKERERLDEREQQELKKLEGMTL